MATIVSEILQDLAGALRTAGKFRLVTLGESGSAVDVPRAAVIYEGQESLQPDDSAGLVWIRLSASVALHTRSDSRSEAAIRINQLCEDAMAALLVDRYRGARCHDLPVGKATEVGRAKVLGGLKRPEVALTFDVRCHFETGGA